MASDLARPSAAQAMQAFVSEQIPRIAKVAGKHVTPERLTTLVGVALTKTPALATCDKLSILQACMYAGRLGLEPNTPLQHAYFIPYNGQCQLQIGYRGMVELVRRSGYRVQSEVVYANDEFSVSYTDRPPITHKPKLTGPRGEIIGAWALVWREDEKPEDATPFWMPIDEIEAIKRKSAARNGPWSEPAFYAEMVRKTVIKRACKHTPMNELVAEAAAVDDGEPIPELEIITEQAASRGDQIAAELGVKRVENTAPQPATVVEPKPTATPAAQAEPAAQPPAQPMTPAPAPAAPQVVPTWDECCKALRDKLDITLTGARQRCTDWLHANRGVTPKQATSENLIDLMAAVEAGEIT